MITKLEKHLHIICLNVPYPADYGGVFDLFYKLPALQQQGVKIHLHCFDYGRGEQPVLNQYCESVQYYKRKSGLKAFSLKYPYIVSSRINEDLLKTLCKDDYPIFMEGVHCTFPLFDQRFKDRKFFVRLHNVEYIYYEHLSQNTSSLLKKSYFSLESILLKKYEQSIVNRATFWGVIEKDNEAYRKLGCKNIDFLPLYLPKWEVKGKSGKGNFCLYHGDLSVGENEKAAKWLIKHVFNGLDINLVIAGKNPSKELVQLAESKKTCCIIVNPSNEDMQDLIEKAHINLIPSFNSTGIKIKMVNALFNGRHCLVNESTVDGTGLEELCYVANDESSYRQSVIHLFNQPFQEDEIALRKNVLGKMFSNERNAKQMVKWIWG